MNSYMFSYTSSDGRMSPAADKVERLQSNALQWMQPVGLWQSSCLLIEADKRRVLCTFLPRPRTHSRPESKASTTNSIRAGTDLLSGALCSLCWHIGLNTSPRRGKSTCSAG